MDISKNKVELKRIFQDNLGINIETKEQEEQALFYFNSNFTPAKGTYLFVILYTKYNVDLSDIIAVFKNKITFKGILNYICSHGFMLN